MITVLIIIVVTMFSVAYGFRQSINFSKKQWIQPKSCFVNRLFSIFRFPVGADRHLRLDQEGNDLDVTFLGTSSAMPTLSRTVSATALRYNHQIFLFDCGEGTQIQVQQSNLKLSNFKKIFITHMHGDHLFGLSAFLCFLGSSTVQQSANQGDDRVIDIYGPEGIREYLRMSLKLSYSLIAQPYRVHELKNLHTFYSLDCKSRNRFRSNQQFRLDELPNNIDDTIINDIGKINMKYGERPGGTNIYPDDRGIYHVTTAEDKTFTVKAASIAHTVPCVGYVFEETRQENGITRGNLKMNVLEPIVESQRELINEAFPQFRGSYRRIYSYLKDLKLKDDEVFTFPNGQQIKESDILQKQHDRKIVIMGDTCDGQRIIPIAQNADVLIHEATNAYFSKFMDDEEDEEYPGNLEPEMEEKYNEAAYAEHEKVTILHGHSTPQMAGKFAASINAKKLVLTHFSSRYKGDSSAESMRIMWQIEDMAKKETNGLLSNANDVIAAWDLMRVPIPLPKR